MSFLHKHMNLLNLMATFTATLKGAAMSPAQQSELRRMERRTARAARYHARNMGYPYSSTRQNTRELRPNRFGRSPAAANG